MKHSFNSCRKAIHDRRSIHGEANSFLHLQVHIALPQAKYRRSSDVYRICEADISLCFRTGDSSMF